MTRFPVGLRFVFMRANLFFVERAPSLQVRGSALGGDCIFLTTIKRLGFGMGKIEFFSAIRAKSIAAIAGAAVLLGASGAIAAPVNLIENGDFEAGNTGFSSDFEFKALNAGAREYTITTDPNLFLGFFASFGDNTSGAGNMFVGNGSTDTAATAWSQTVDVNPGEDFAFSFFMADAFSAFSSAFEIRVNGVAIGSAQSILGVVGEWEEKSYTFSTDALTSSIVIAIVNTSSGFTGNDFALDDISLFQTSMNGVPSEVPLPAAAWLFIAGIAGFASAARRNKA